MDPNAVGFLTGNLVLNLSILAWAAAQFIKSGPYHRAPPFLEPYSLQRRNAQFPLLYGMCLCLCPGLSLRDKLSPFCCQHRAGCRCNV